MSEEGEEKERRRERGKRNLFLSSAALRILHHDGHLVLYQAVQQELWERNVHGPMPPGK